MNNLSTIVEIRVYISNTRKCFTKFHTA